MHVSLTAEKIFDIGPLTVTNALLTTWIVLTFVTIFAIIFRLRIKKSPTGIQNIVEISIEGFHGLIESVTNNYKQARKFFAVIFTIFLFVLLNNWAGLLPGVGSIGIFEDENLAKELKIPESEIAEEYEEMIDSEFSSAHIVNLSETNEITIAEENSYEDEEVHSTFVPIFRAGSADLSFTLALAIIAVLMVQIAGVSELGGWGYFKKFLNFKNPIHFFVGILEIISEFSKMVSFSFRLFGNIFAGEVLLAVIISLVPFVAPMPFYGLEIFVGLIQAVVFSILTLVFFKMATTAH